MGKQALQHPAHLGCIHRTDRFSLPLQPPAELLHVLLMGALPEKGNSLSIQLRLGITVGKVDEVLPCNMGMHGESRNAGNHRFLVEADLTIGRLIHAFQCIEERRTSHVEVPSPFIAATILRQHGQITVQHAQGTGNALALAPAVPLQQKQHVNHIGKNPGRPVAHILADHAHPPEVIMLHEGHNDSPVNFQPHPTGNQWTDRIQLIFQQIQNVCQHRRRLRRKQIHIGIGHIRQEPFVHRRTAGMITAVVGTEHPGGFLTDAPEPVNHRIQIGAVVQQAFAQGSPHQQISSGKVGCLIHHSVARPAEGQELGCRYHRESLPGFFRPGKDFRFFLLWEMIPRRSLLPSRKRMIILPQQGMQRMGIYICSKHFIPSCQLWQYPR